MNKAETLEIVRYLTPDDGHDAALDFALGLVGHAGRGLLERPVAVGEEAVTLEHDGRQADTEQHYPSSSSTENLDSANLYMGLSAWLR